MAKRGGFQRPIQLGPWMQDYLSGGRITWAFDAYRRYREALAEAYQARGKKGKRGASYRTIRNYLFMLRKLGWIEYTGVEPAGEERSGGRFKMVELKGVTPGRQLFQITGDGGTADWNNITASYKMI